MKNTLNPAASETDKLFSFVHRLAYLLTILGFLLMLDGCNATELSLDQVINGEISITRAAEFSLKPVAVPLDDSGIIWYNEEYHTDFF